MLINLTLTNVGPAPHLALQLAPRLNLLTGDNGLGKSFLLDVAWWVLTRKWPHDLNDKLTSGYPARPANPKAEASIAFQLTTAGATPVDYESRYAASEQSWLGRPGRPWNPGLVVYAHADGGFSVWDPARNYWKRSGDIDVQDRVPGYVFSPKDVWDGLEVEIEGRTSRVCNGLLADWAAWIRERGDAAQRMEKVLHRLAPKGEGFRVGPFVRLSLDDARDIPSIIMPYGEATPILHAASGVRRAVGLAYMLLWSWNEHVRASELRNTPLTSTVILLFDEIESHLHPRWQRSILGSLLHILEDLHEQASIQLLAATHSPLILASAEPFFDPAQDAWFDLDLVQNQVVLNKRPFTSHGDLANWLTSNAFDFKQARSQEAEDAIELALALLREREPSREAITAADQALRAARLPDIDPFWVRWGQFREAHAAPAVEGDRPQ
jgi:hypothetical protein